jgi:lactoylglutathione lyase
MFNDAYPIIATPDMARALGFYRDLLEGEIVYQFPPDGDPVYVGLNIGDGHLGIGLAADAAGGAGDRRFALWVYADSCDEAVDRLRAAGATVTEEPADEPWGERVARVLDPDGNEVLVGQKA